MKPTRTLRQFYIWLAKQPADREFNFFDNNRCLLASFATETDPDGKRWHCPGYEEVQREDGVKIESLPGDFGRLAAGLSTFFKVRDVRAAILKRRRAARVRAARNA